jgi:hypothetical protein
MKRLLLVVFIGIGGVTILWLFLTLKPTPTDFKVEQKAGAVASTTASNLPAQSIGTPSTQDFRDLEERKLMGMSERLKWLEQHGSVPNDADAVDWQLAQKTSWWGKPLDSKEFWKDQVVWFDKASEDRARRKGRAYPPMPYDDSRFASYANDRDFDDSKFWNIEGPNIRFRGTERESAFWTEFIKTKPHPPERLAREQYQVANAILGNRYRFEREGNPAKTNPQRLAQQQQSEIGQAQKLGSPAEAVSEEALFWSYVMKQREEYETRIAPLSNVNQMVFTNWTGRLFVDRKYVIESLTTEQLATANSWKVSYLQRLRRDKVDESYINAYLKAWNLTSTQVFGAK